MAAERPDHTLDATGLVHEAYVRLTGDRQFDDRAHFFAAAAEAMRRILIDHARRHEADKRGGGRQRLRLGEVYRVGLDSPAGLLALDDVLTRFAAEYPRKAEVVRLRFFAGLTTPEAAAVRASPLATAERWWLFARTWLYAELGDGQFRRTGEGSRARCACSVAPAHGASP